MDTERLNIVMMNPRLFGPLAGLLNERCGLRGDVANQDGEPKKEGVVLSQC